jgi:hypothetical protein
MIFASIFVSVIRRAFSGFSRRQSIVATGSTSPNRWIMPGIRLKTGAKDRV